METEEYISVKKCIIEPQSSYFINDLPFAYMCGTYGTDSETTTLIMGICNGTEPTGHKISTMISSDIVRYEIPDDEVGLKVCNDGDTENTVFLVKLN